jgi:hypothetical protein
MAQSKRVRLPDEPLGIVISRGSRDEVPPTFRVYIWAAAPEPEQTDVKAA